MPAEQGRDVAGELRVLRGVRALDPERLLVLREGQQAADDDRGR